MSVRLTPTELRVLALACEGQQAKDVGAKLGISFRTVEHHLDSVRAKLLPDGHGSLIQLYRRALELGLLQCPCQSAPIQRALKITAAVDSLISQLPDTSHLTPRT